MDCSICTSGSTCTRKYGSTFVRKYLRRYYCTCTFVQHTKEVQGIDTSVIGSRATYTYDTCTWSTEVRRTFVLYVHVHCSTTLLRTKLLSKVPSKVPSYVSYEGSYVLCSRTCTVKVTKVRRLACLCHLKCVELSRILSLIYLGVIAIQYTYCTLMRTLCDITIVNACSSVSSYEGSLYFVALPS